MSRKEHFQTLACLFVFIFVLTPEVSFCGNYTFSGGPAGGTFKHYATAISDLSRNVGMEIRTLNSRGSIENIKRAHTGMANFGIAYSGDVFKARNGGLKKDRRKYKKVMAMAYFYSAPAQLVVRADSKLDSTLKLAGKRVGVGNFGSGAAANCELFFKELGLWDKVVKRHLGYKKAAIAFKGGELDAFWLFTGFPNSSVIEAAKHAPISLINVYKDAEKIELFKKYPYFQKVVIPVGTYEGVSTPVVSFQDSAVWIVNSRVPNGDVYRILDTVFSREGLKYMMKAHKSAKAMNVDDGTKGIVTPLHPGAEKFWKDQGIF